MAVCAMHCPSDSNPSLNCQWGRAALLRSGREQDFARLLYRSDVVSGSPVAANQHLDTILLGPPVVTAKCDCYSVSRLGNTGASVILNH